LGSATPTGTPRPAPTPSPAIRDGGQRQQQQQQQQRRAVPAVLAAEPEIPLAEPQGGDAGMDGGMDAAHQRWINADLEGHEPDRPLLPRQWYTLAFDVDVMARTTAVGAMKLAEEQFFPIGSDDVLLTVQVDSTDFEVSVPTRPLRIGRTGKSELKAKFDVSPLHEGSSKLKATIHKDGNFIQQMELAFEVGAGQSPWVGVIALGRPASAVKVVRARDVGLLIRPTVEGYDCTLVKAVATQALLPLQPVHLANAIETVRRELMKVVMHRGTDGSYVFQTNIDMPQEAQDFALRTMARAGADLFRKMFFGPGARADSQAVGNFLRTMAADPNSRLKLQIVASGVPVPWGLLYIGEVKEGAELDWDNFIGMRHVIEQIPLQNIPTVADYVIQSAPQLAVSVNVNRSIDLQLQGDYVAQQELFWETARTSRKTVGVTSRTTRQQVMAALADGATGDQIVYFYCHAKSAGLTSQGSPDDSCLVLSDASITLGDLNVEAPTTAQLCGNPLIFINACESAEMSPTFYDGFVPYFMAKGARGVVGTECQTPALFAVAWAKRFFERFLDGEPLGEAFLELRREFVQKHGNPLGLLYGVHCDGDTQIDPALVAAVA
jgi:CHAT domain